VTTPFFAMTSAQKISLSVRPRKQRLEGKETLWTTIKLRRRCAKFVDIENSSSTIASRSDFVSRGSSGRVHVENFRVCECPGKKRLEGRRVSGVRTTVKRRKRRSDQERWFSDDSLSAGPSERPGSEGLLLLMSIGKGPCRIGEFMDHHVATGKEPS
jgi:hypothetical protein